MNVAVRSSLTTGVALATAGALVASPIAPVPPDIKVPAVHADVALTAVPNRLLTAQLAAPAQAAEAIIDLLNGFSDATNLGLAGLAAGVAIGAEAVIDLTDNATETAAAVNTRLTRAFRQAIREFFPAAVLSKAAATTQLALVDDLRAPGQAAEAFIDLLNGFSDAVNIGLEGFADSVAISAGAVIDLTDNATETAAAINTRLTRAVRQAIREYFPAPEEEVAGLVATTQLRAPGQAAEAFIDLLNGFSDATNLGLEGFADSVAISAGAVIDLTDNATETAAAINTRLTRAVRQAIREYFPATEAALNRTSVNSPAAATVPAAEPQLVSVQVRDTNAEANNAGSASNSVSTRQERQQQREERQAKKSEQQSGREAAKAERQEQHETAKADRETNKAERQEQHESAKAERQEQRESAKAERQEQRESAKADRETKKAERQQAREAKKADSSTGGGEE